MLVNSATCASLFSHDLLAKCAVTPVRNFLCKNWSVIASIDKQIKVWLVYRFFERHLPWSPPWNNAFIDLKLLNPSKHPKICTYYWLKSVQFFVSCLGIFWHKVCWTGRGRRSERRVAGDRRQDDPREQRGREEWVGQWSIIIWQWTLITRQQPIRARLSPRPANQRPGACDGAG